MTSSNAKCKVQNDDPGLYFVLREAAMRSLIAAIVLAVSSAPAGAQPPSLAFQPGEKGYYNFDTGLLRGTMRLDGKSQGICPLVYVPTGQEIAKCPAC